MITIEEEWERQSSGQLEGWRMPVWRHPRFREIVNRTPLARINWILPVDIKKGDDEMELSKRLFMLFLHGDWDAPEWGTVMDRLLALKDWKRILPSAARTLPIQLCPRFPFDLDSLQAWEALLDFMTKEDGDADGDAAELVRAVLAKAMQESREPRRAALFMRTVIAVVNAKTIRYGGVLEALRPELSAFALTWIGTAEGQALFNTLRQTPS
jgi:hypothetical protein